MDWGAIPIPLIKKDMANYIMQILRSQLVNVLSWGFHSPETLPNNRGLKFLVNGYLHQGTVEVVYNDALDLFEVRTLNNDGSIKESTEDVYLDCLVNTIDGMVERTSDYHERVMNEYKSC